MKSTKLGLLLLTLFVLFSGYCLKTVQAEDAAKYRVGVILPLSGPNASLGKYVKNGIDLAFASLPEPQRARLELLYEDDQLQASRSVSAFQKLLSTQGIKAVLVLGSGIGNALAPLAERSGIVLIAIGASDGKVAKGRKYAFTHWVTPEVETQEVIKEMQRRNYRNIGIIMQEQEGAIALYNVIVPELKKVGWGDRIVLDEKFLPDQSDFRTYISKAKSRQVEALLVALFPGQLSAFAKQTRSLGLTSDLIGFELFEDENEVKASEGALIGQWYVNADTADESFVKNYQARYHEHPGWGAANAYDSLTILAKAVNNEGQNNEKIAEELHNLRNYKGAAGSYSASGDNRFNLPAAIKIVKKDGFEKLGK